MNDEFLDVDEFESSLDTLFKRMADSLDRQNVLLDRLNDNLETLGRALPNLANSPVARLLGMNKGK